ASLPPERTLGAPLGEQLKLFESAEEFGCEEGAHGVTTNLRLRRPSSDGFVLHMQHGIVRSGSWSQCALEIAPRLSTIQQLLRLAARGAPPGASERSALRGGRGGSWAHGRHSSRIA